MTDRTIGLLGGGQLGQMLCEAANPLGIKIIVLDHANSPAKQVNAKIPHLDGSFMDPEKIRQLARQVDVITVEIEHVDTTVLEEIAEEGVSIIEDGRQVTKRVEVQPSWRTLRLIQDKFLQKEHLIKHQIAVVESRAVEESDLEQVGRDLGYPFMLKARKEAYDGRGNFSVMKAQDIPAAVHALTGRALYAEKWADFTVELAVMVVKTENVASADSTIAYPVVETIHEDSVCKLVYAPARDIPASLRRMAQEVARDAVGTLWGKGVFGVEMFVTEHEGVLVNEIAPRPHNSGHYTIEACPTMSQYKAQLLSILNLMPKLPDNRIVTAFNATIMLNILGGATKDSHNSLIEQAIALPNASLHMYGKESKPARKIGHVTLVSDSMHQAESLLAPLHHTANAIRAVRKGLPITTPPPHIQPHLYPSTPGPRRLIAITMGSDSDLHVLRPGLALLTSLRIPYHLTITSAHRTPTLMTDFAQTAVANGIRVIIAAAGGAAHLPGMIAASTVLPVIGVPVKGSSLDGMDSLLSIVQMPRGVPVAAVAVNNSINAALLALRILGTGDEWAREALVKYARINEMEVRGKAQKLERTGWEYYEDY